MKLEQLEIKLLHIKYCAVSTDVAQRSFNKCTAKQMSLESGFKCG